jgi:hypothetical protein
LRRRLTMIMQGKTPRSLSWAGFLAIVGLGVLLLPVHAQAPRGETEQQIEKLKQALRTLEEKHKLELADGDVAKKASAEEIAKAKAEADALGKVADARRKAFEAAALRHQQAMARLAKLEGKPAQGDVKTIRSHVLLVDDANKTLHSPDLRYRAFVEAAAGAKGEPRTIILRVGPDGKVVHLEGNINALSAVKGEPHRVILNVDANAKYDDVSKLLKGINEKGAKVPLSVHVEARNLDMKPDGKTEKQVIQYRLASPDSKPGANVEKNLQFKLAPGEKKDGQNSYRLEFKSPDGKEKPGQGYFLIEGAPAVKSGEKILRYEIHRVDDKPETARIKKPASASDRAADLEKKIERLQQEIQELKDALKKSGASLSPAQSSLHGIATR